MVKLFMKGVNLKLSIKKDITLVKGQFNEKT